MPRTLLDQDLTRWDVYIVPGRGGFADSARVVFHPPVGGDGPPRFVEKEGGRALAEGWLSAAPIAELRELLRTARPIP
jgi:hypothetical protein